MCIHIKLECKTTKMIDIIITNNIIFQRLIIYELIDVKDHISIYTIYFAFYILRLLHDTRYIYLYKSS